MLPVLKPTNQHTFGLDPTRPSSREASGAYMQRRHCFHSNLIGLSLCPSAKREKIIRRICNFLSQMYNPDRSKIVTLDQLLSSSVCLPFPTTRFCFNTTKAAKNRSGPFAYLQGCTRNVEHVSSDSIGLLVRGYRWQQPIQRARRRCVKRRGMRAGLPYRPQHT